MKVESSGPGGESIWPIRSFLFVPANRPEFVGKAARAGAEAVLIDLEDAIRRVDKADARRLVPAEIADGRSLGMHMFVRVNAVGEGAFDDLAAVVVPGLAGIVLPKASSAAEIRGLADALSYFEGIAGIPHGAVSILPLPETAVGLWDVDAIARASPRVKGIFGSLAGPIAGDIAVSVGFHPTVEGEEQFYLNSRTVLASRAGGAAYPVAGIIGTRLDDLVAVEALIARAKRFGYKGAVLVHPSHVAIANRIFRPTPLELAWHRGLLEAFDRAEREGSGVVVYDGRMIDYGMLPLAREIVAEGDRLEKQSRSKE